MQVGAFQQAKYTPLELRSKKVFAQLDLAEKYCRYIAKKSNQKHSDKLNWFYWVHPDTAENFISFVPPNHLVVSNRWVLQADTTTASMLPAYFHVFSHYFIGHYDKRTESLLSTVFGGSPLPKVFQFNQELALEEIVQHNGGMVSNKSIYSFNLKDEVEAERLADVAFQRLKRDTTSINEYWKLISPNYDWVDDFFRIHPFKNANNL